MVADGDAPVPSLKKEALLRRQACRKFRLEIHWNPKHYATLRINIVRDYNRNRPDGADLLYDPLHLEQLRAAAETTQPHLLTAAAQGEKVQPRELFTTYAATTKRA